jgi:hypothetical protein
MMQNLSGFSDTTAAIAGWIVNHSIYGMSSIVAGSPVSAGITISIALNSLVIILFSTVLGLLFFRKYEL